MSDRPDDPNAPRGPRLPGGRGLRLGIDAETARGRYANVALVAHTETEVFLDFALAYPGTAPQVQSRIVTSPRHAKALLRTLQDNLRRYEARYGEIPEPAAGARGPLAPPTPSGPDDDEGGPN